MSSIKEGRYKPRLYFSVFLLAALLRDSVVVVVRTHEPYHEKIIHGFPLIFHEAYGEALLLINLYSTYLWEARWPHG